VFCFHKKIAKKEIGKGVVLQVLGRGEQMNVLHWNMADNSVVPLHHHAHEQFGYVIKGGFAMNIGGDETILKAGDAYFIPPDVPHEFRALGETEAIDVFHPIKEDIPDRL